MYCPRLDHFVRLNHTGKIGKCGHMTRAPEFNSFEDMQDSAWLKKIKKQMEEKVWPKECVRCAITEETSNTSIRLDMIERDRILTSIQRDYLIVGGVLDNICNSACIMCNPKASSLLTQDYKKLFKINPAQFSSPVPYESWTRDPVVLDRVVKEIVSSIK